MRVRMMLFRSGTVLFRPACGQRCVKAREDATDSSSELVRDTAIQTKGSASSGRLVRVILALLIASISALWLASAVPLAHSSNTPAFGREVIVDHQRVAGEPSISIDSQDRIYVVAPFGFSTTASFLWRSTDHGQSFHLVPGNLSPFGKPFVTCVGGGDSALAVDTKDRLYFADLQGLTDISNSVSSDQGAHWLSTCNAANAVGVDRPWIATFGDPQDLLKPGALYQTVDQIGQCVGACDRDLGQVGSNIVEITRSQDGVTFTPLPAQQIEPDGIVSGIVTDPNTGDVYIAHTGLVDQSGKLGGADANSNDNAILVVRFPHGYNKLVATPLLTGQTLCQVEPNTCTTSIVYRAALYPNGNSTVTVGQDFAPIAIDRAGNLYVTWSQATVDSSSGKITGPSQIYMAVSTDHGATWGAPVRVTAATPTLQTNVFPWIAAGDPGRVDIVWYGTPTLGSCPNQPCGSSALINAHWSVMMAQSLNAIVNGKPNASPSFTTTQVSEVSNHFGAICTMGIGCTTGGDRGLIDFLSVTVGLQGEANVVWADAVNRNFVGGTSSALIAFNRQIAGASLYANVGQVTGPAPASGAAVGSRDAFYSAVGMTVPATGNLVIKSASVTLPDPQHYRFKIVVSDLSTLLVLPTLGGTDAVWLVRWEVPDPNGAGHLYFAAMESDGGMTPTFYDGETLSVNTTHGKFLTYNRAHSIQGSYTATSPGVITLDVPVADVGGNADATLFSITALTATLVPTSKINSQIITASSTSTGPIFNQIDATAPFDFPPQAAPPPGCRQADGDGDEPGKNGGTAHFHFHHDDCNQQPESEDFSDSGSGTDFHSTQVTAVSYDTVAHTVTIVGLGTNNGLPVAFTIVAVDSTLVPPGVFSITLSDGYSNTGSLLTGSILLR